MAAPLAEFAAPWGRSVRRVTALTCSLMAVIALIGLLGWQSGDLAWRIGMVILPIGIALGALPWVVRGYRLTPRTLEVKRLGWRTVIGLTGLQAVTGDAEALRGAWRLFGNGGLYAISGVFWSRRLGRFRVWATDPARAVVLRFADRTVVISPDDPVKFIIRARILLATAEFPD